MELSIKRDVIADGVGFSAIVDTKLKTNVLKIKFITELSEKEAPLNSMAAMLIGSTNNKIKTYSEMSDRLNALYGSSIYTDTSKSGDCQLPRKVLIFRGASSRHLLMMSRCLEMNVDEFVQSAFH